jgi:PII-like signaling protein
MEALSEAKLLRVFIGESDKVRHVPLYEAIVREAKAAGLAGATAWRGLMGFGPSTRIRTAKILDLSADLPVVVEITDEEARIAAFLPELDRLFADSKSGGLVTLENVQIIRYRHGAR